MKDALGHGSETRGGTHASKVDQIGRPVQVHPNVLRVIQKNPWGASVKPQTGVVPKTGTMVSVQGRTFSTTAAELAGPRGQQIIRDFSKRNSDLLSQDPMHIGSWADETGKVHLDVSENIPDHATAVREGIRRNQMGIWDNARKKLIATGGTGD
jgi:hypothetical protein